MTSGNPQKSKYSSKSVYLSGLSFQILISCRAKNSLNEKGYTVKSTYLPVNFVANSPESKLLLLPVIKI
jgi:hypothetical protein